MENQLKFEHIDLGYMKEIGRGNLDFEKKATELFIEIIPENLADLEKYLELKSYDGIKRTLHNMHSSIGIMGLDKKLSSYMNIETISKTHIKRNVDFIILTCIAAIEEAKFHLKTFE